MNYSLETGITVTRLAVVLVALLALAYGRGNQEGLSLYGNTSDTSVNNLGRMPSCTHQQALDLRKSGQELVLNWSVDTAYYSYIKRFRNDQPVKGTTEQQMVYASAVSKSMLQRPVNSFKQLFESKRIKYEKGAELLVNAVQNMTYFKVEPGECHSTNSDPCIGGIPFGLLYPVETIVLFGGDCDSKTLLLYCLLKQIGYDVAIVGSSKANHVLLGIANIPLTGFSIEQGNKKYYLWETSEAGWIPGDIPKKLRAYDDLKIIYNN